MKKTLTLLSALALTIAAEAQTLNVVTGNVTYQFPAAQAGDMTYSDGTTLTIMGKTFALSDISKMYVDATAVTDNQVTIAYSGTTATLTVAGNVAQYVTPTLSGAHVSIAQSNTAAVDGDEITYTLSGTTTDGEFALAGSYKCTVSLAGLTLTNPSGAAINITNGKRIQLSAKKDTENTLTDGANGSQKACLYSKGQLQLQGNGILNVKGNTAHAIKSGDYISVKNLTLNVTGSVKDGISCNEYFLQKSGTITLSGIGDDGIQCDLDGTTATAATDDDHSDEDTGNIYIEGGTINATLTATAAKGLKSEGEMNISGGTITISTSGGGEWDSTDSKTSASAALKSDGNMTISGGTLNLTATGAGGKGISGDGTLLITGGDITVNTSGAIVYYSNSKLQTTTSANTTERLSSNYKSSPKGIKVDGALTISGGTISVTAKYHEGIESKSTIDITDGIIYSTSGDDAINSASTFTISGGTVCGYSTGNDGLDANGNFNITGGIVYAIGTSSPELGIDANTEGGYKLTITGGTVVAIGGLESGSTLTQSCYQLGSSTGGNNGGGGPGGNRPGGGGGPGGNSGSQSWTANTWYALYSSGNLALAFKTPSSGGTALVVSTAGTPTLTSGVTVSGDTIWNGMGSTSGTVSGGTSASLSAYSSGNNGGGNPFGH